VNSRPITVTVNSRKYDGAIRRTWNAELVTCEPPFIKLIGVFDKTVEHSDLGVIETGTTSYEYFWTDRWHNIFRFHNRDGSLRNFYVNLSMPPTFDAQTLDYVDLDIDIVVWPDGALDVLDRDDFEANAKLFDYTDELKQRVEAELEYLVTMITAGGLSRLDP